MCGAVGGNGGSLIAVVDADVVMGCFIINLAWGNCCKTKARSCANVYVRSFAFNDAR